MHSIDGKKCLHPLVYSERHCNHGRDLEVSNAKTHKEPAGPLGRIQPCGSLPHAQEHLGVQCTCYLHLPPHHFERVRHCHGHCARNASAAKLRYCLELQSAIVSVLIWQAAVLLGLHAPGYPVSTKLLKDVVGIKGYTCIGDHACNRAKESSVKVGDPGLRKPRGHWSMITRGLVVNLGDQGGVAGRCCLIRETHSNQIQWVCEEDGRHPSQRPCNQFLVRCLVPPCWHQKLNRSRSKKREIVVSYSANGQTEQSHSRTKQTNRTYTTILFIGHKLDSSIRKDPEESCRVSLKESFQSTGALNVPACLEDTRQSSYPWKCPIIKW